MRQTSWCFIRNQVSVLTGKICNVKTHEIVYVMLFHYVWFELYFDLKTLFYFQATLTRRNILN